MQTAANGLGADVNAEPCYNSPRTLRAMKVPCCLLFLPLLASATQVPFMQNAPGASKMLWQTDSAFEFKSGANVFTPKDLVELPRPGAGVANDVGDLVLVPVGRYSFKDKE